VRSIAIGFIKRYNVWLRKCECVSLASSLCALMRASTSLVSQGKDATTEEEHHGKQGRSIYEMMAETSHLHGIFSSFLTFVSFHRACSSGSTLMQLWAEGETSWMQWLSRKARS
jgi:hypothetical protein